MPKRHLHILRYAMFVCTLYAISIAVASCENKEEKARQEAAGKADMIDMIYRPDAELLGIKYGIETEKVLSLILDEHPAFGITDDGMDAEEFKDRILGKNIAKLIDKFSKRYSIPRQVVASILVDYRTMRCTE